MGVGFCWCPFQAAAGQIILCQALQVAFSESNSCEHESYYGYEFKQDIQRGT